jgi:lipopolysaccharide biosynthesis glycosyltransferase
MSPVRVFIGLDKRQPVAANVLASSIVRHASKRVQIEFLKLDWMPVQRRGLTDFTYSRYLVPWLCDYQGKAVFLDADMIVLGDICELEQYAAPVSVVQNRLRFEWPSMMVFNCELCTELTLRAVEEGKPQTFSWASSIGALPAEWNFCVGYDQKPEVTPKLIHYTQGIPCWPETQNCDYAEVWKKEARMSMATVSWQELMGNSVHAQHMRVA